jgi:hypothetical protein
MTDNASETLPRSMPIDTEHFGIRIALPAIAVAGFLIGFALSSALLSTIISETQLGCIPFIGGIVLALFFAFVADKLLKRLWPSGRALIVDQQGLVLEDKRGRQNKTIRMQWGEHINPVTWRFKVRRSSAKVQKGWMMLSVKLVQDESEMIIYSFLPEKEASLLPNYDKFIPLMPRAELESDALSLREKGEQKRLLATERERWEDGAEIQRKDFFDLITILMGHVSDWRSGGPA